jgi:biopolymer transport protein ExbD
MSTFDEKVRDGLKRGFGGDDPGPAFDAKVIEKALEKNGGEHEISVDLEEVRRPSRWWIPVGAAAAALLAVVLWRGFPGWPESGTGGTNAGGGREGVELPVAKNAQAAEGDLVIEILEDESVRIGGKKVDLEGLDTALRERAPFEDGESVLIRADRRVRWRMVQWVMQACAKHRLWKLSFETKGEDGKSVVALPVPLPKDRGLQKIPDEVMEDPVRGSDRPMEMKPAVKLTVELKRKKREKITRIQLLDSVIGEGDDGFEHLDKRIGQIVASAGKLPVELNAWAWVPHADVVKAIDTLMKHGITNITFIGAPPTGRVPTFPREEVRPEPQRPRRVLIDVNAEGRASVDGEAMTASQLIEHLENVVTKGERAPNGESLVVALIRCEADVPWDRAQYYVKCCRDAGISKVQFATVKPKPPAPTSVTEYRALVLVRLERKGAVTSITIGDEEHGEWEVGLLELSARLAKKRKDGIPVKGRIVTDPTVPFGDVTAVQEVFRKAGVTDLQVTTPK